MYTKDNCTKNNKLQRPCATRSEAISNKIQTCKFFTETGLRYFKLQFELSINLRFH